MTDTPLISPLGLTRDQFVSACADAGIGSGKAKEAYTAFFRGSVDLQPGISGEVSPVVRVVEEPCDEGLTRKFLQRLAPPDASVAGGRFVDLPHVDAESVVIPMIGRTGVRTHTLCVSSQIGCAMGCGFCETAQMGLIRSLSAAEIVGQWWAATHRVLAQTGDVDRERIGNIVFMGMGEPLDNLDAVLDAIACLTDHHGPALPMSKIMISTVGRVDGLRRLAGVVQRPGWKRLGLALSVNAPNDTVRDELMPINRKWDMAELQDAMVELVRVRGSRKLLFEYVLIPGVNDTPTHAAELVEWMKPFARNESHGHIGLLNVIPYNPRRDSPWPAPTEESVDHFVEWLRDGGLFVKRRRTKGRSQMAACGQLGSEEIRSRRYVPVTIGSGGDAADQRADV